jgi:hypothetical protein
MLYDNYMAGTAQALRNALAIDPPPLRVTTDNGATVFLGVLKKHRRRHHQTKAYIYSPGRMGGLPIGGRHRKSTGSREFGQGDPRRI